MATAGSVVEGLDFVREQLEGLLPREMTAVLRRSTLKIAARIRDDMRENAPRRTGNLRKAITAKRDRGDRDTIEARVDITQGRGAKHDAYYWKFVEYGTKTAAARPFVAPAVERARATYRADLADEIGRQVIAQLEKRARLQRIGR